MRLIEVLVPESCRDGTLDFLDDEGLDYVLTREGSDGGAAEIVQIPVPTQAVEYVLTSLRDLGIGDEYVVVSAVETARTPGMGSLEERFVNGDESDESIAREEIRTRALNMVPGRFTYYAMTMLSAVVATAGLLLDSPAIVVGSMVIAPQVSAALTGTVGLVLNDRGMILGGINSLLYGLAAAICGAFVFASLLRYGAVVPSTIDIAAITQVENRISPGLLAIVVGVSAGAAGAFGLATALPVSLVGVMVAVALIPAAAAVGIGLAWGYASVAIGAFVLVVVNALSILLSGFAVFWYLGYRPDGWERGRLGANVTRDRIGSLTIVIVLFLCALAVSGFLLYQHVLFESAVNDEARQVLDDERYADLEIVDVQTQFDDRGYVTEETEITVVVGRPADETVPELAGDLERAIADRTGRDAAVTVEFVERSAA